MLRGAAAPHTNDPPRPAGEGTRTLGQRVHANVLKGWQRSPATVLLYAGNVAFLVLQVRRGRARTLQHARASLA